MIRKLKWRGALTALVFTFLLSACQEAAQEAPAVTKTTDCPPAQSAPPVSAELAENDAACRRELGLECNGYRHMEGPINAQMHGASKACINNETNFLKNGVWEVQAPTPEYCVALSI